jgi:hypothetical protein
MLKMLVGAVQDTLAASDAALFLIGYALLLEQKTGLRGPVFFNQVRRRY